MFIHHNGTNIIYEPDSNSYLFDNLKIWFKGYFFHENKFYQAEIASNYLNSAYLSNTIEDIVPYCNGIFTCVIIDEETKCTHVYNDRFGFGYLFYITEENEYYISDNFWLLQERKNKSTINHYSAYELMMFHYVFAENTLIEGITEILPSSVYLFEPPTKSDYIKRKEYWKFKYRPQEKNADYEVYTTLNRIISKYKEHVFDGSNIAINLTGGFDSRFLLALMLQNDISTDKISSYTFGLKNCDDVTISEKVAKIAGIKHNVAFFENFMDNFFYEQKINEILCEIGFRAYYFQGYGAGSLTPLYKDTNYLLTGADGFCVGLFANKELFNISTKQELVNYIYKKSATFQSAQECTFALKNPNKNLEAVLKNRISETLPDDNDYISNYYDWMFKNKLRKLIVGIHEILNKKNLALYPFYDYEFIDLMASVVYGELYQQKAYYNALFKYALKNNLDELKNIPTDLRGKAIFKNENWELQNKIKTGLFYKIIKKIFNLPRRHFTYPIFKVFRFRRKMFLSKVSPLFYSGSQLLEPDKVLELIKKKKRHENFFIYGLPNIISVFAFEKLIDVKKSKEQSN